MEFIGPQPELQHDTATQDAYLPEFADIGPRTFLYTPQPVQESSNHDSKFQPQPGLLIVCSWMYAQSRYIKKYTKAYQQRYPHTPILLLRQDGGDLFYRPVSAQMKNLAPAVSVIKDYLAKHTSQQPKILMHIFSNGGAYTACQFADAYRASTSDMLPISALILDSTPGLPSASRSHTAICEALPKSKVARTVGGVAVWAYLGIGHFLDEAMGKENITISLRRRLNDPNGAFMQGNLKRLYIYSQADALIPAADVEAHGMEAVALIGEDRVQMEDFVRSRHVGHVMTDERRYWDLVDSLWKESQRT